MKHSELKTAIENNTPLVWNDPLPIEGNDYTITYIDLPELEEDDCEDDLIILIQYGEGSEAEVLLREISPKYPDTIGEILPDGKIEKEYYGQGIIYKNFQAFGEKTDEVCYSPELSDETYTYQDFLEIAKSKFEELQDTEKFHSLAQSLFELCDWQHPETLMEEWEHSGEFEE